MRDKIGWIGTVSSIVGAFMVANMVLVTGYAFFMLGALAWIYVGVSSSNKALITCNGFFFAANIMGLYNALAV